MRSERSDIIKPQTEGFTLLEVLIGISLTTLLLVLLSEVAFFASHSFSQMRDAAREQQRSQSFRILLVQSLEAAYPYQGFGEGKGHMFIGTRQGVTFLTYGTTALRTSVELQVGSRLLTLSHDGQSVAEISLANFWTFHSGANDVCLRYFGTHSGFGPAAWFGSWDVDGLMPKIVAITNQCEGIIGNQSDSFNWEYYFLPVTASGACKFDDLLQRCRGGI